MASPAQVDAALLRNLICLKQQEYQDSQLQVSVPEVSEGIAKGTPVQPSKGGAINQGFQPQRKYFLEGRIIHKRKLSKRLFFLDVSLVRRKKQHNTADSTGAATLERLSSGGASTSSASAESPAKGEAGSVDKGAREEVIDGLKLSGWEDDVKSQDSRSDKTEAGPGDQHHGPIPQERMEVISRFPVHTLKELDDLWRRVQLGAVVRVFGDIEISEKKGKASLAQPSATLHGDGTAEGQASGQPQRVQWSALLHCLDFAVLETWQGQDAFEPNPGAAEVGGHQDQSHGSTQKQDRKRKCDDMGRGEGSSSASQAQQQQRGDASQPHCKFWLNSGKCNKEHCPFWHELDAVRLKAERRRWVEERVQAKRQISHHVSDPHQKTTKNQHRERALYFAQWLISTFTREFLSTGAGVLDVAGGRGDLSWELQTRQGIRSTIIEPRAGKGMRKWQRKWLEKFRASNSQPSEISESDAGGKSVLTNEMTERDEVRSKKEDADDQEPDEGAALAGLADFIPTILTYPLQATEPERIEAMMDDDFLLKHERLVSEASILIGLHPDQATEPIVRAALKAGKPFAVIPCCVFSRDNLHRRLPKVPSSDTINSGSGVLPEDPLHADEDASSTRPVTSYDDFVTWLSTLHPGIETTWLNFEGMNRVLYWRGPTTSLCSST